MPANPTLLQIYKTLYECYGPQHWWPAEEPFEVVIGAILTQSTAWTNVQKALQNLKNAEILNPTDLRALPVQDLAALIRPSGYYNVKARKLKAFVEILHQSYDNSLEKMFSPDIPQLRSNLLSIYGIGQETADSIILYAAKKSIFVIDAYTHRIMDRLGLNLNFNNYESLQAVFMAGLPHEESLFNEYHALFVRHGKEVCNKTSPLCQHCCLNERCQFSNSAYKGTMAIRTLI